MSARQRAEACILEIKSWMTVNKLKLNDEKTGFLIHDHQIEVDTASIPASESARNLGIIVDNILCMEDQIRRICEFIYFHIRNTISIKKIYQMKLAAAIIRHALTTSCIDYGNSLLTGITDHLLRKLQLCSKCGCPHPYKDTEN